MKKNGFTLVEILGVLVIIGVIAVIATPLMNGILKSSRDAVLDSQVTTILNAAYDYSLTNPKLLPNEENKKNYIILSELKKEALIPGQIQNSVSGLPFEDNLVISISNIGKTKLTDLNNAFKKGNYLFKIEEEFMNTEDFINNKPSIEFDNYLDNQKIINVNLGSNYESLKYKATSFDKKDITNKVVVNIYDNLNLVSKIDTSKIGIYNINYSVVDDSGYSTLIKVNVNVVDLEPPKLIFPESNVINVDIEKYNLKDDVICSDNSNICEFEYTYKKITDTRYIVTYKATDPTGNTIEEERVIIIEK